MRLRHFKKGKKIGVCDIVDSTGTFRLVEIDVRIGFVNDKDVRFDMSKFQMFKKSVWNDKSFVIPLHVDEAA